MTTIRTDNDALTQRITLFEQAATYALETLSSVTEDALDHPSPCDGWRVRDVVLHVADVSDAVIELIRSGELAPGAPRSGDTADPVGVAQERIHALRDAITDATRDSTGTELLLDAARAGANELAAHGWDIATALDMDRPIPDATAAALLVLIEGRLTAANRGDKFAAAVPVSASASPSERFVAYLGRRTT